MNCQKLHSDIEKLKSLRDELSAKLEESTESGLGKVALFSLSHEASNSADTLLEEYAYDLAEQNIKDKSGRNTEFLNSILEQYIKKDEKNPDLPETLTNPNTTINDVRDNLGEYLKIDQDLENNLVVYALKEKLGSSDSPLKDLEELYKDVLPDSFKNKTLPRLAYLHKIAERVKNLEILETESYIFMLPKDKWEKGKIKLPNPNGNPKTPEFIAPSDLTAILKSSVYYDWSYETDGQSTDDPTPVYDGKWIGREIKHFPWSKELIQEANEKLLKPNGYRIPTKDEFVSIYNNLKSKLAIEQNTTPDNITGAQISTALQEDLNLASSGGVFERGLGGRYLDGGFWSTSEYSARYAHCLAFDSGNVSPEWQSHRVSKFSVRCVS